MIGGRGFVDDIGRNWIVWCGLDLLSILLSNKIRNDPPERTEWTHFCLEATMAPETIKMELLVDAICTKMARQFRLLIPNVRSNL